MSDNKIKKPSVEIAYTPDQIRELQKCVEDPIYFIKTYVKIQHPTKGTLSFDLFEYQEEMLQTIIDNKDTLILASRQLGKCCSPDTKITTCQFPKNKFKQVLLRLIDKSLYDNIKNNLQKIENNNEGR